MRNDIITLGFQNTSIYMKIFFLKFKVTPTVANEEYEFVEGAYASCWVRENDAQGAYTKATFYIEKGDWSIASLDIEPVEVTEKNFESRDLGLEHYAKAKNEDISLVYTGWARDGKSSYTKHNIKSSYKFNIGGYLKTQKKLSNRRRCLHYDAGSLCNKIINAHSIQKSRSLSMIADDTQHVYKLSSGMRTLKDSKGVPAYKKRSIYKPFTFIGFCKDHDNELFEPIDNSPLIPTDQQIFLYAYRSLCREYFVKENSFDLYSSQQLDNNAPEALKGLFQGMDAGTKFGFKNLKRHKQYYDESLRKAQYHNINYVLFCSRQEPTIAFSGLIYPDFDFMGRQLQNLADYNQKLDLITFCSAPLNNGWGYFFAWHNSSDRVCDEFMRSLATKMYDGEDLGDMLFRLLISCCENHAISPKWWDSLSSKQVEEITERASWMVSPFCAIKPSYLQEGLQGIVKWEFNSVLSTMDDHTQRNRSSRPLNASAEFLVKRS